MSKWNLFDVFSHVDMTKQRMPRIRKTAKLSKRRVQARVMDALAAETEGESMAQRCWRFGRVPAIFTAAALLVSGSAITAAASAGGFSELFHIVFGEDTAYPSGLEELYAVPDAEITDTCDEIDCRVAGVFGDSHAVTVVLEFTGENGYTLPEKMRMSNGGGNLDFSSMETGMSWSTMENWTYDPSDDGHWYYSQQMLFDDAIPNDGTLQFSMDSGLFLKPKTEDAEKDVYYYAGVSDVFYEMRDIRNWLGYTGAEINQRKPLSAEDEQRVWDNFVCVEKDKNGDGTEDGEERVFILKDEVLVDGSISISFPLEYPTSEPLTDSFVYTDEKTGEETPMEMTLSPWCAVFSWDVGAPMPSLIETYVGKNAENAAFSAAGHVKLADGTLTEPLTYPPYAGAFGSITYSQDAAASVGTCTLTIQFAQPVDPNQVDTVYYLKDTVLWKKA